MLQSILLILLFVCLIVNLWLVIFTITRPDREKSTGIALLCCTILVYTLGYLGEILAVTADGIRIALIVENFAIPNIAPLFLVIAVCFFAPEKARRWHQEAVALYGLIFFCIVLTNDFHGLYYRSISIEETNGMILPLLERGPLYYVNQAVAAVILLYTYWKIIFCFNRGNKKIRKKKGYFLVGSALPFAANIINYTGILPLELDPTPLLLTLGTSLFSFSLIKYDVMNAVVLARNKAVEWMDDALIVLDDDRSLIYSNRSAGKFLPLSEKLRLLKEDEEIEFKITEQGNDLYYHASVQQIKDQKERFLGWFILLQDITENKKCIEKLEALAGEDVLTGQYNRRKTEEMIQQELEVAKRYQYDCAVLIFDIDHFKRVNDTYGHAAGDRVLQVVARSVKNSLRSSDIFGRIGGEEFLVFTRSSGTDEMFMFAERLRKVIEAAQTQAGDTQIRVTASFGIAEIKPGESYKEAIKNADEAMYRAKHEGRNRVCIYESNI